MTQISITSDTTPNDAAIAIVDTFGEFFAVALAKALERHAGLDPDESTEDRVKRIVERKARRSGKGFSIMTPTEVKQRFTRTLTAMNLRRGICWFPMSGTKG